MGGAAAVALGESEAPSAVLAAGFRVRIAATLD